VKTPVVEEPPNGVVFVKNGLAREEEVGDRRGGVDDGVGLLLRVNVAKGFAEAKGEAAVVLINGFDVLNTLGSKEEVGEAVEDEVGVDFGFFFFFSSTTTGAATGTSSSEDDSEYSFGSGGAINSAAFL